MPLQKRRDFFDKEGKARIAHIIDGKRKEYCGDFELPKEESSELVSKIQNPKSKGDFTPLSGGDDDLSVRLIDNYDDL